VSVNSFTTSSNVARYLRFLAAFVILLLAAVASFNAFIDPYDVFGSPSVDGINRVKHGIRTHTRTAKAYVVKRLQPKTIILGSSRSESAFRPSHPAFIQQPVYNLAFSGAGIYEMLRYFQHATAVAPIREAVVAVDFGMFDAQRARPTWDFDESRLAVSRDGQRNPPPWRDLGSLLLSADALKESSWSLRHQRDKRTTYGSDGLRDESYDIPEILNEYGGHRKTFMHNEQGFACGFLSQTQDFTFSNPNTGVDTIALVAELLDHAQSKGVKITLLIPPIHVRHLEVIHQSGLWPRFEEWKRRLVGVADIHGVALWDFSQANPVTTEAVPPPGDNQTAMHWFRESSHALSSAGTAALDRIYGIEQQVPGYGRRLQSETLDADLASDRRTLDHWRAETSVDVAEITDLLGRCAPNMERYASR